MNDDYIVHPGTAEYVAGLPEGHRFHSIADAWQRECQRDNNEQIVNIYGVHIPVQPGATDIVVNLSGGPRSAVLAACVVEAYRMIHTAPTIWCNTFLNYFGSSDTAPDIHLCNKRMLNSTDNIIEALCHRFRGSDIKKSRSQLPRSDIYNAIADATDSDTADRISVAVETAVLQNTVYPAGVELTAYKTQASQVYSAHIGEPMVVEQLGEFQVAKYTTISDIYRSRQFIKHRGYSYTHHQPFEWADQHWINTVVTQLGLERIVNLSTTDLSSARATGNYKDTN